MLNWDGDTVRAIRIYQNNMSTEEFAEKIGCSSSSISMIEGGHRRVTKNMVGRITKAIDLTDDLMEFIQRYKKMIGH